MLRNQSVAALVSNKHHQAFGLSGMQNYNR
jgi:hypothetical protein